MAEFMTRIPSSIIVKDENGSHFIGDDDTVFCLTLQDFMLVLENSREFYENPTPEVMRQVLAKYLSGQIITLVKESNWYIRKALPHFLKNTFQKRIENLPKAS